MLRACAVYLFLLLCPLFSSQLRCDEGGRPDGSCSKIKDEKYQIRGVNILPMWKFVLQSKPPEKRHRLPIKKNSEPKYSKSVFIDENVRKMSTRRAKIMGVKQMEVPTESLHKIHLSMNKPLASLANFSFPTLPEVQETTARPPTIDWSTTPPLWWTAPVKNSSDIPVDIKKDHLSESSQNGNSIVAGEETQQLYDWKAAKKRAVNRDGIITGVDSSEEEDVGNDEDEKTEALPVTTTRQKSTKVSKKLLRPQSPVDSDLNAEETIQKIVEATTESSSLFNEKPSRKVKHRRRKLKPKTTVQEISANENAAESGEETEHEEEAEERPLVKKIKPKSRERIKSLVGNQIEQARLGGGRKNSLGINKLAEKNRGEENGENEEEVGENVLMNRRKPEADVGAGDSKLLTEKHNVFESSNIRTTSKQGALKNTKPGKYHYPPKTEVPLPTCFHNPSGYVCCNLKLNNLIEETYEKLKSEEVFNPCNIGKVARTIQRLSQEEFDHPFESIVSLGDFAQNVHFAGDMVCKLELDGKFMLAYATPYNVEDLNENEEGGVTGGQSTGRKRRTSFPIHHFRM